MLCYVSISCRFFQTRIINEGMRSISMDVRKKITECCKILDVSETSTSDELKNAFVSLARKYHPDSGSSTADAEKFAKIQAAYRYVRENLFKLKLQDDEKELLDKDFDIKHTVPQHRHYLTHEGIGYGTPSQRQKQYNQHKINQAAEQVFSYRSKRIASQNENTLLVKDAALARQFKTSQAVDRLVEDLIQEAMARGEFSNLPGSGKPLKYCSENPYVDSMTHKLNQILINNGFTPDWIVLEREIQTERNEIYSFLRNHRNCLGQWPLNEKECNKWNDITLQAKTKVKALNMKIDKFNMVVPMLSKQKLHFQLSSEAEKILKNGKTKYDMQLHKPESNQKSSDENFFSFLWNLFH